MEDTYRLGSNKRLNMLSMGGHRGFVIAFALSALLPVTTRASTLHPPALDRLPAGAILPKGWLLAQAHVQAAGETGGLASWDQAGIAGNVYLPGTDSCKIAGLQGGEYFLNGVFPLTCEIDVPELRDIRDRSVAKILHCTAHSSVNGTLMGDIPWTKGSNEKNNYWGRMIIVFALQTYIECVGPYAPDAEMKAKVEAALVRHYQAMYAHMKAAMPGLTVRT